MKPTDDEVRKQIEFEKMGHIAWIKTIDMLEQYAALLAEQAKAEPVACIDPRHLQLLRKNFSQGNCLKHPDDATENDVLLYGKKTSPVIAQQGLAVKMTNEEWALGAWLSAALGDDKVCDAMKRDITAWMDLFDYTSDISPMRKAAPSPAEDSV